MRRLAFLSLCLLPLILGPTVSRATPPDAYDPCRNGSLRDGKARSCAELKRWLRHRERFPERREGRRERYDPCTDGSISDGRPRTCRELRRRFYNRELQDWD